MTCWILPGAADGAAGALPSKDFVSYSVFKMVEKSAKKCVLRHVTYKCVGAFGCCM